MSSHPEEEEEQQNTLIQVLAVPEEHSQDPVEQQIQLESLYEKIGGEQIVDKVVDVLYKEMVKDFDLNNVRNCTPKRIELLKKQQKAFLIDLLGGPTTDASGSVQNVRKRNNAQNFQFFLRVLSKAFEECEIDQEIIEFVKKQLLDQNLNIPRQI